MWKACLPLLRICLLDWNKSQGLKMKSSWSCCYSLKFHWKGKALREKSAEMMWRPCRGWWRVWTRGAAEEMNTQGYRQHFMLSQLSNIYVSSPETKQSKMLWFTYDWRKITNVILTSLSNSCMVVQRLRSCTTGCGLNTIYVWPLKQTRNMVTCLNLSISWI